MSVIGCVASLNSKIWHSLENVAEKHTNTSRALLIPTLISFLAIEILSTPFQLIESLYLLCKNILLCSLPYQGKEIYRSLFLIRIAIATPVLATIECIRSLVKGILNPLKMVKLSVFTFDYVQSSRNFQNENQIKFYRGIYERFNDKVERAKNRSELAQIHFLGNKEREKSIFNEINAKIQKLGELNQRYINERQKNINNPKALKKIEDGWKDSKFTLIKCEPENIASIGW